MSDELIIYKNPSRPTDGVAAVIPLSDNKTPHIDGSLSGRKVNPGCISPVGSDFFSKKVNDT